MILPTLPIFSLAFTYQYLSTFLSIPPSTPHSISCFLLFSQPNTLSSILSSLLFCSHFSPIFFLPFLHSIFVILSLVPFPNFYFSFLIPSHYVTSPSRLSFIVSSNLPFFIPFCTLSGTFLPLLTPLLILKHRKYIKKAMEQVVVPEWDPTVAVYNMWFYLYAAKPEVLASFQYEIQ